MDSRSVSVIVFRIAAIIGTVSISLIGFFTPIFIKEYNKSYFHALSFFCTGSCFGVALVCFPLEALAYIGGPSAELVVTALMSSSLMLLVVLELLSINNYSLLLSSYSYSYSPLVLNENYDDDNGDGNELTTDVDAVREHDIETSQFSLNPIVRSANESSDVAPKLKRHFPSAILVMCSVYAVLDGFTLGSHVHTEYGNIVRLVYQKAIVALTLSTVMEYLDSPKSYLLTFATIFSLSAPIGIFLGSFIKDYEYESIYLCGVLTAICAGPFLFLAAVHLLPAQINDMQAQTSSETVPVKLFALILGFILTTLPSVTMDYEKVS